MDEVIELGPQCRERYFCRADYPDLGPLGIAVAGWSQLAGHYRVEQCLPMHLVEVTLDGTGQARAGGWSGVLRKGAVLLIPAGTPLQLGIGPGATWTTAWVHLEPRRWRRFPRRVEARESLDAATLAPLLGLLYAERDRGDPGDAALKRALSETFVLAWRRLVHGDGAVTAAQGRQRAQLAAIFEQVRERPGEPWDGNRLAALAGCSRSQLHRRCVDAFGRAPAAQITRVRMQEAEYWLTATGLPLKVIAERLGYANPYHFSTAFKRWSGVAPARYRTGST